MTGEELEQIEGVGEKVAQSIVHYFNVSKNKLEINQLLDLGIRPKEVIVQTFLSHPFQAKTFVLTGSLEHYTRSTAASLIKERGGIVTASVSKKTDFVLAGNEAGSKLNKAQQLGIQILEEQEFTNLL